MRTIFLTIVTIFILLLVAGGVVAALFFPQIEKLIRDYINQDSNISEPFILESRSITWYQDQKRQINLALFSKPLNFFFTESEAQSVREQALQSNLELAINGTYYIGSYVNATHSGLLQIRGDFLSDFVPNVQLTHTIVYNHANDSIEFVRARDLGDSLYFSSNHTLLQTGPLLIVNNQIQHEFINGSLNGGQESLRTVLGYTSDGEVFFAISRTGVTLTAFSEQLLQNQVLRGKQITVINLDGGASTAMFSKDLEQFNFRESARLPLIIGISLL